MLNPLNKNFSFSIHIPKSLQNNTKMIFWMVFGILLILEGFVLKNSISIVFSAQQDVLTPVTGQGVRINFDVYKQDLQRMQNAGGFVPASEVSANPFDGTGKGGLITPAVPTNTIVVTSTPVTATNTPIQ
jgi:hypothetical protein